MNLFFGCGELPLDPLPLPCPMPGDRPRPLPSPLPFLSIALMNSSTMPGALARAIAASRSRPLRFSEPAEASLGGCAFDSVVIELSRVLVKIFFFAQIMLIAISGSLPTECKDPFVCSD